MYIVQCKFSEAGEEPQWNDLNEWFYIHDARSDLKDRKIAYNKNQGYKWRIIKRNIIHKVTEKIVK